MLPLTETSVRASFVNASRKETSDLLLPAAFDDLDWESLDYLGWRDPKRSQRAYVVVPTGDDRRATVGLLLRQADASPRSRAQCSWCQDVQLPNDVVLFSAKRAGAAGRNGDTVASLVCSDFECSANVRVTPKVAYLGFDVEAARTDRIESLRNRAAGFVETVVRGA